MSEFDVDPDLSGGIALTFTPRAGTVRTIYGLVDWLPVSPGDGGANRPRFRVTVRNHATLGIDVDGTDTIRGSLTIPKRKGYATSHTFDVAWGNIESQDAGCVTLVF